ncbi:hypothetical protein B0T25DRAFT_636268 [Lasiosphaeria hispida]|uniref:Uncharacterized protein n=1 Tax=Lasiosphaeria hispida TaxID=260671 RepID=A0AAJ0H558_9PEZI|nr:hypothetical protein B0T25DRAFT_636268 [Lasiosphaeria hispida]
MPIFAPTIIPEVELSRVVVGPEDSLETTVAVPKVDKGPKLDDVILPEIKLPITRRALPLPPAGPLGYHHGHKPQGRESSRAPVWAVGRGLFGAKEDKGSRSYQTAPGIVFAYRLHVVRPKGKGNAEGEVFSDRTVFLTGEAGEDDDDEGEEMELVAVDAETARNDPDMDPDTFSDEQKLEEGDESYTVN